jgi:3-methyladenine DNA glycosylase/8-oxoguanine DNA glycosylase
VTEVPRPSLAAATAEVAARDPALARLIGQVGPLRYPPRSGDGPFAALARAIVFQQLAGRAAQAILGRVTIAAGGALTPEGLAAASDEQLRAAGLSGNKLAALRDLSARTLAGEVNLAPSARDSDESVIESLVQVRGIGRWTAEMFMIFELRRLDVWPVDDLGVRQGYGLVWGVSPAPLPKQLTPLGDRFRPYRSIVARYCWEAVALSRDADTSLR